MNKSNEHNFVERLQMEKEDALEYIVHQYLPLIKGISLKILSPLQNEGLIDECINDIFLSIWNHASKFKGDTTNFKYWIASIAKFKAIDYYRKTVKNTVVPTEDIELIQSDVVEEQIISSENKREILAYIHTLDPVDQKIIIMRLFLGMKSDEISEKLGISKSAIDSRLSRGKKKLKHYAINLIGGNIN